MTKSVLLAMAFSLVPCAFSQDADPAPQAQADQPKPAEILKKYDKDGDGKLSDDEKKAMHEDWLKGHPKVAKSKKGRKAEFMKNFDKDGDGMLSEEELKVANKACCLQCNCSYGEKRPHGPHGLQASQGGPPEQGNPQGPRPEGPHGPQAGPNGQPPSPHGDHQGSHKEHQGEPRPKGPHGPQGAPAPQGPRPEGPHGPQGGPDRQSPSPHGGRQGSPKGHQAGPGTNHGAQAHHEKTRN